MTHHINPPNKKHSVVTFL